MLTKSQIKLINSLKQKKFRIQHQLFVVEGLKVVQEFLNSDYELVEIFAVDDHFSQYNQKLTRVDAKELSKISGFSTPNKVVAAFKIPSPKAINWSALVVALDSINDPGNLGTIIRIADWFGIQQIICSPTCVDVYSPKVVQATMGSIFHIEVVYSDLQQVFEKKGQLPVYAALLQGDDIFEADFSQKGFILMGNESQGIQQKYFKYMDKAITISRKGKAESLNVAVATSIICAVACR